jgi:hypothetical protein
LKKASHNFVIKHIKYLQCFQWSFFCLRSKRLVWKQILVVLPSSTQIRFATDFSGIKLSVGIKASNTLNNFVTSFHSQRTLLLKGNIKFWKFLISHMNQNLFLVSPVKHTSQLEGTQHEMVLRQLGHLLSTFWKDWQFSPVSC